MRTWLLTTALSAFAASWLCTRMLTSVLRGRLLDIPNARSCHRTPIPRGGGLGVLAGLAAGLLVAAGPHGAAPPFLLAGALLVAACGWWDDIAHLPASWRLLGHTAAAAVLLAGAGPLERLPLPAPCDLPLGPAAVPFSLAWIVGFVNIYNFLDGIDGYAGAQALIAGLAIAACGFNRGSQALGLALAGAAAGFLFYNWHPARIFLGDVGSTTIGYLLAAVPFGLDRGVRATAAYAVALCAWFFLTDGAWTLLRRLFQRKRLWEAHREHLYQRLVIAGLPHDAVASRVAGMAALLCLAAIGAVRAGRPLLLWAALALAVIEFLLYLRWVQRRSGVNA